MLTNFFLSLLVIILIYLNVTTFSAVLPSFLSSYSNSSFLFFKFCLLKLLLLSLLYIGLLSVITWLFWQLQSSSLLYSFSFSVIEISWSTNNQLITWIFWQFLSNKINEKYHRRDNQNRDYCVGRSVTSSRPGDVFWKVILWRRRRKKVTNPICQSRNGSWLINAGPSGPD